MKYGRTTTPMDMDNQESLYGECPICKAVKAVVASPETLREWHTKRGAKVNEAVIEHDIQFFRKGLLDKCLTEGRGKREDVLQRWVEGKACSHTVAERLHHIHGQYALFGGGQ